MTLDEATERMNRARALLADALLPRDHGVYWCARDVDQRKIDEALEWLITNAPLERCAVAHTLGGVVGNSGSGES